MAPPHLPLTQPQRLACHPVALRRRHAAAQPDQRMPGPRSDAAGGVWVDAGATFQIFDLTLTNNGQRALNGGVVTFTLTEAGASITQFWELSRQGSAANAFSVAFNDGALQAGATQGAGIVVRLAGSSPAAKPAVTLGSLGCQ